MIEGTNYFVSHFAAYKYYKDYGCDKEEVRRKIRDREIIIGFPPVQPGKNIRDLATPPTRWHVRCITSLIALLGLQCKPG